MHFEFPDLVGNIILDSKPMQGIGLWLRLLRSDPLFFTKSHTETEKFRFWVLGHGVYFFLFCPFTESTASASECPDFCRHLRFTPHIMQVLAPYFTYYGPQSPRPLLQEPITPIPRAARVRLQAYWSCFQFLLHFWDLGISLFFPCKLNYKFQRIFQHFI